jgi:hypothetical protein|tara:strand:+ start:1360 stop:2001 length:642 start_codon:yes stop_codon:yes gene_type:complete
MADRSGYIGRAPGDSSVTIARQSYNVSGVTTDFTFSSSYTPTLFDVYINGAKLVNISDYAATDGNTFSLVSAATGGDVVEAVAYKAFNLANPVTSALGNFSVGGDLTVTGSATVGGVGIVTVGSAGFVTSITAGSNISVSGATGNVTITGLANTSNVVADNLVVTGISTLEATTATALNVTGVVTATAFVGSGAQLTGIAQPTQLDITSSLFT